MPSKHILKVHATPALDRLLLFGYPENRAGMSTSIGPIAELRVADTFPQALQRTRRTVSC